MLMRGRRGARSWGRLAIFSTAFSFSVGPAEAVAQLDQLRAVIVDEDTEAPLAGALAEVLSPSNAVLSSALSDQAGVVALAFATPGGTVRVRIRLIGYRDLVSDPIELGETQVIRFALTRRPFRLPDLVARAVARCSGEPDEVAGAWRLFSMAQADLRRIARFEGDQARGFAVAVVDSLQIATRRFEDVARDSHTILLPQPIVTQPAADLLTNGFVRPDGRGGVRYLMPSAQVVSSRAFENAMCFNEVIRRGGQRGVRFTPITHRRRAGIEGVIWIDESDRVSAIEFAFVEYKDLVERIVMPGIRSRFAPGARVRFRHLSLDESEFGGRLSFGGAARDERATVYWELRFPLVWTYDIFDRQGATIQPRTNRVTRSGEVLEVVRRAVPSTVSETSLSSRGSADATLEPLRGPLPGIVCAD